MSIAASGVVSRALTKLGYEVSVEPSQGYVFPPSTDAKLRQSCDFLDGMAKTVAALDTVIIQGGTRVGFLALPGAIGQAITEKFGVHIGERFKTATIIGSDVSGACAIGALVAHRFERIIVLGSGPGVAVGAAHRMGVDILFKPPSHPASGFVVASTGQADADVVLDLTPAGTDRKVVVQGMDVLAWQLLAQLRAITATNPQLTEIRAALS